MKNDFSPSTSQIYLVISHMMAFLFHKYIVFFSLKAVFSYNTLLSFKMAVLSRRMNYKEETCNCGLNSMQTPTLFSLPCRED